MHLTSTTGIAHDAVTFATRMRLAWVCLAAACSSASSADVTTTRETAPKHTAASEVRAPVRFGDAENTERVTRAWIAISVDGSTASGKPAYARADQKVAMHAVVETKGHVYSDAPLPAKLKAEPLAKGPRVTLAWSRVEPTQPWLSNGEVDTFHYEPIEYKVTVIEDADGAALAPDVRPTLTPDYGHGVGTMRYQLAVTQGDRVVTSPGTEAKRGGSSGGLTDDVTRVSIRRDDTYLGYLTEMMGQPYIWASSGPSDATHQSERLEGADCADFVVYGERRLGKKVAYTWTGGLPDVTKLLAAGAKGDDGVYRDKTGGKLPFGKPGDLVLFPRHVGVLVEDRGELGVLDDKDIMMHALFDTPKEQAIADSGYADKPVELRRW